MYPVRKAIFIILVMLLSQSTEAQQIDSLISGYWSGELTQKDGGYTPSYLFSMQIEVRGDSITGQAVVSVRDTLTATMDFVGTIHKGGYLSIKETNLVEGSQMSTHEWCLKHYSLYLRPKDDEYYLVGFWTGTSPTSVCLPGKIKLKRRIDRV